MKMEYLYIVSLFVFWQNLPIMELSRNLALNRSTTQSSNYSSAFLSPNAVDGLNKECSFNGIAHTLFGMKEWWQVDLGELCEIKTIQIFYRQYFFDRLDGYSIDIIQSLNPLKSWQCFKDTNNELPDSLTPSHPCPSLGRYVKFSREEMTARAIINLCELEVYGCPVGRYGTMKCDLNCSIGCLDSRCDPDNGKCNCSSDWTGEKCEHRHCDSGYYRVNDRCISCPSGCLENNCSTNNGTCLDGCNRSQYGQFCNLTCPSNCYNMMCDMKTGACSSCKSGYYGKNCTLYCPTNCRICNQDSGLCESCHQHFVGNNCTESRTGEELTTQSGPIIGGVFAAIVIMIVVVVLLLLRRRRNSSNGNGKESQVTLSSPMTDKILKDDSRQTKRASDKTNIENKESIVSIENGYSNSPDVYMNLTLTEVPISELSRIIAKKAAEKEFATEYDKLPNGLKNLATVGKHPDNKIKNRFLTTFPYDHSRIVLKPLSAQQNSDYINANYIDGAEFQHAYIATQGPKTNTLHDFWRMVWQENSGKIVMLTNLIENEKPKCEQYWSDIGQEKDFGPLKVTMEKEKEYSFLFERTLLLTNKKTKETRRILQFHFTMWPDHGTPDPVQLMLFHRKVKDAETTLTGPPIVHCAAGVGRTGTFIALDTLHEYGDKTGKMDIFEYVLRMRKDRMNMIQTLDQYIVLHEALLESFQYTGRAMDKDTFFEVCNELNKEMAKNITHIYKEFQNLVALRPVYGIESYDSALDKENRRKSRNQNILAVEKYRPYLMSQHSSRTNFINAVMLPTFRKKCGYFATHYPLEDTVVDFWCMVFDHDSSTIVVLDEISDKDKVLHWYPIDDKEMNVDLFTIRRVSGPHINGKMKEIEFTVTHQDDEKSVRMLMIRPWPTGRCIPPDKREFLRLIEMTMKMQITASDPVTIVCSDGALCCGLFCTVSNIILNLQIEDEIDIFHTVRQLQIRRPQFITDYEEYKGCYEMVKAFLDSENVYANV